MCHDDIFEIAINLVSILESLGLKDEVKELDSLMKGHQDKISPFNSSLFSKIVSLSLFSAKSDEFVDYMENTKKLCPNFSNYLIKYTYDLLLSEKFESVIDCIKSNDQLIRELDDEDRSIIKINEATALKKMNGGKIPPYINIELEKIIAKAIAPEITISCKSLMDDPQTFSNIKSLIGIDHHFYYSFLEWPAINDQLKKQLRSHYEATMLITFKKAC
ncbi:hypothetical protein EXU29_02860 [Acinetobacter wuhouensis]|uniref:hypothetical protein n=1 Tax=Acinetobacter wuhouensis TaxID=1879050 RepID=UPI0010239F50|nr:hypothetical protein [Acinetobacter wuhouensis]RZG75286.1 hypothetical protein EXU29_02860 [Acinetobacter wuhouensis]